jgi:formate/nitrite transporter FocA (FNT family)
LKDKEKTAKKTHDKMVTGGLCIAAGILIGIGIGGALDHLVNGMLIGLGGGFFTFAMILILKRN